MDERFLGFILVVFTIAGLVAWYMALRYRKILMLHNERMAALEKGVPVPVVNPTAPWSVRTYFLRGLLWTFSGVALSVFILGLSLATQRPESAQSRLERAHYLSRQLEIPLDQATRAIEQDQGRTDRRGVSTASALIGLVPVGVGLAYLVFYFTDERRMRSGAPPSS
jgi:hypothetical protein